MLVDDLIDFLQEKAREQEVVDIRVGISLTAVKLDNGRCGLASTLVRELAHPLPHLRPQMLYGSSIRCLELANSDNFLMAAIGMATVNALSEVDSDLLFEGDALQFFDVANEDTVCMIGSFLPLIPELRKKSKELWVFERYAIDGLREYKPDWAGPLLLPQCEVVVISGTSFTNKTIDWMLPLCAHARTVAVIGPTTPMIPEVLKGHGITLLSGMEVIDPRNLLQAVSLGSNTQGVGNWVRKVNLRL